MSSTRIQPLVAMRALKRLVNDPEQTEQVFVVLRALSGNSIFKSYKRFAKTATGRQVLDEGRVLLTTLQDREALRALPAESLGRHYLTFVEAEQITADGLVEASEQKGAFSEQKGAISEQKGAISEQKGAILDEKVSLYAERTRDQHDLWHTLTGYGRDTFGEACLLAFTYAQTRNPGIAVIALVGMVKLTQGMGSGVKAAMWQAYLAGRRAAWLPEQDWEALLPKPIEEVRAALKIPTPQKYREVFERFAMSH